MKFINYKEEVLKLQPDATAEEMLDLVAIHYAGRRVTRYRSLEGDAWADAYSILTGEEV